MTGIILLSLLALAIAAVALLWLDGTAEVVVYEIALVVAGVAWWRRMAAVTHAGRLPRSTRHTPQRTTPSSLARLERVVAFATTGFEAEHRLLPILRRLAYDRLAAGHRVDLELQPDRAAELLGPEAWILIGHRRRPIAPIQLRPARPDRAGGGRAGAVVTQSIAAAAVTDLAHRAMDEVERAVVGKRAVLELLLVAILADGHALIEDVPGVAKTLIARSFAKVLGLRFARVQFTPDLMPMDVTGSVFPGIADGDMTFRPGPIFANLVLADEVNRAPAKTQAALLEAMEERQVTADGKAHQLERPFLVIATQNPIEFEGTYPLPEAELDRFILRLRVGISHARRGMADPGSTPTEGARRGRPGPGDESRCRDRCPAGAGEGPCGR